MQIDRQCDRLLMSTEEKEYLAKISSTIATLNLESIASIDVLKLCIVCSRFYPRIEIGAELRLLKAEIEACLRGGASESSMERHDVRFVA